MLDELRTLIAFAETGSLQRAAARVFRTPSAVTRQIQRLERELGTPLLDRSLKPARLTAAGRLALEPGRELMRVADQLRTRAAVPAEPAGPLRLGIAHAVADPRIAMTVLDALRRFPAVQPCLSSDTTSGLYSKVRSLDLDAALVLLPVGTSVPAGLEGVVLGTDRYRVVQARGSRGGGARRRSLARPWIVNPVGCLVRAAVERNLQQAGLPMRIGAEMHDLSLQLALIGSGAGLGVVPRRLLAQTGWKGRIEPVRWPAWDLAASVGLVFNRPGHFGPVMRALEAALAPRLGGGSG